MRKKICHVITKLELGGAQQNTLYTVSHLDSLKYEPVLVAGPGGLLDDDAAALDGVESHFVPSLVRAIRPVRDLRALFELTRLFRRLAPDVVHTHSSKAGILGRWAAHLAGVPVVVHSIHGFGFTPGQSSLKRRLLVAAERATARLTTKFVGVSQANLTQGIAMGLFDANRAVLIRSGIELSRYTNGVPAGRLRSAIGASENTPVAGMVACLKPQKAPGDFVAVAARVARSVPDAQFVLVGDGDLRPGVEEAVRRENLSERFHLLGWRRDVPEILRDLDVLVLTSRWEGLPRVFPEAMALGKPVVACSVDGAPEAIRHGENGFLCEPGDVEGLAGHLAMLLADPARARAMGASGRTRATEWDIDKMVRAQERLYDGLLQST